jgi:autotransporter passenger strand-loop-strand repeat protein
MSEIIVSSGVTTSVSTLDASNTYLVERAGVLDILNGGLISGLITVDSTLNVSSGGTTLSTTINQYGYQYVWNGGIASGTTISYYMAACSSSSGRRSVRRSAMVACSRSKAAR